MPWYGLSLIAIHEIVMDKITEYKDDRMTDIEKEIEGLNRTIKVLEKVQTDYGLSFQQAQRLIGLKDRRSELYEKYLTDKDDEQNA